MLIGDCGPFPSYSHDGKARRQFLCTRNTAYALTMVRRETICDRCHNTEEPSPRPRSKGMQTRRATSTLQTWRALTHALFNKLKAREPWLQTTSQTVALSRSKDKNKCLLPRFLDDADVYDDYDYDDDDYDDDDDEDDADDDDDDDDDDGADDDYAGCAPR